MSMNQWIGCCYLRNAAVRHRSCRRVPDYALPDKIDYNQIRRDDIVSTTQNWHKLSGVGSECECFLF